MLLFWKIPSRNCFPSDSFGFVTSGRKDCVCDENETMRLSIAKISCLRSNEWMGFILTEFPVSFIQSSNNSVLFGKKYFRTVKLCTLIFILILIFTSSNEKTLYSLNKFSTTLKCIKKDTRVWRDRLCSRVDQI